MRPNNSFKSRRRFAAQLNPGVRRPPETLDVRTILSQHPSPILCSVSWFDPTGSGVARCCSTLAQPPRLLWQAHAPQSRLRCLSTTGLMLRPWGRLNHQRQVSLFPASLRQLAFEFVAISPLDGSLTTELGYTTAWDEEHTLGARFAGGTFIELCGSVLPP